MIHSNRAFVRGVLACACATALALACGGSGAKSGLMEDLDFLATPNSINFGTHSVGEDVVREVTLRHTGTEGTVVIKGIRLAPGSSDEFSWDDPEVLELKHGESVKLFVHYRPVSGENASGTILIDHNVPPEKQSTIQLTALGQVGDLTTVPPVAFGEVPLADLPQDQDFLLKNLGSKAVKIDSMSLKNDDGRFTLHPEFVTPDNQPFPLDLKPGGAIGFVVTFNRTDVGEFDTERLWVYSGTERFEFPVTGTAVGPKIEVQPALVDFGFVKPGATASRDVLVINRGEYDLIVTDVLPFLGANSGIAVSGGPAAGTSWTLAPNQERSFAINWTASVSDPPKEGADLGQVHVISNDMAQSPTRVELKGELDIPCIAPDPEIIDFGYVAQGLATDRFLTIDNPCHGDLSVTALEIDKAADTLGEFSIVADPEFPPTTGTGPGTIKGFEPKGVKIRFGSKAPSGCVQVTLEIKSDAPDASTWPIALKACRVDKATCEPKLVPAMINFGSVAVGDVVQKTLRVRNVGTGNCTFKGAKIVDCTSTMPPFAPTCPQPFAGNASKMYTIANGPSAGEVLGPGMEVLLDLNFNAAQLNAGMFGMVSESQAVLGVKMTDENTATPVEVTVPTTNKANLIGSAGIPKISVLPSEVKFGLVTLGCWSKTYKVCIYNSGSAPLTVSDISLSGCTPEFKLKDVPPLPLAVKPGVPQCIGAAFVPQLDAPQQCALHIKSNDKTAPDLSVKLTGTGTFEDEQTDEFVQEAGQKVDILFVVDDSGSMCSNQDQLANSIGTFIAKAEVWKNDFHMGVVTTNVTDENVAGKLNRGEKEPRYVVPGPDAQGLFGSYVKVGCEGGSDSQEAGFEPMQIALSAPLATDTSKPCGSDGDCKNDPNLCGDPTKCPYMCLDNPDVPGVKTCGGWNKGFVREDAKLEVIILADEDDQSPGAPTFYIDFLRNIKGFYNVGWSRLHAIVWQDSCGEPPVSQTDGDRYMMVAQETGGLIGEICDNDYGPLLSQIGKIVFVPKVQFFLTRLADPPTIQVKVNGQECKQGWNYDAPSNSIIFQESGPCMPKEHDKIWVHYKTLCLQG